MQTFGTGHAYALGYLGAFLVGALASAYNMYGFDTASTLAEETRDPRRYGPRATLQSISAAAIGGFLIFLLAMLAVPNPRAADIATGGMPVIVKQVVGSAVGNILLWAVAVAMGVCCVAVQAATVRLIFAMARDQSLPGARLLARVHGRTQTPVIPTVGVGVIALAILLINLNQPQIIAVIISVAVVVIYLAYLLVAVPLLLKRLRGEWPRRPTTANGSSASAAGGCRSISPVSSTSASWPSTSPGRVAQCTTQCPLPLVPAVGRVPVCRSRRDRRCRLLRPGPAAPLRDRRRAPNTAAGSHAGTDRRPGCAGKMSSARGEVTSARPILFSHS